MIKIDTDSIYALNQSQFDPGARSSPFAKTV